MAKVADTVHQIKSRKPVLAAVVLSLALLLALVGLHVILQDGGALRVLYELPLWLATRAGGRRAGFTLATLTVALDLYVESQFTGQLADQMIVAEGLLRYGVLLVVMLVIAHVEASLSQTRMMALLDPLTGVFNRRALAEFARNAQAIEPDEPTVVVAIDCDGFKRLNDTYGHKAGDHVLQILAKILQYETREEDLVARVGGDEFVLVLNDIQTSEAERIIRRIEERFEQAVIDAGYECTISVGFAPVEEDSRTIEALLETADRDMYSRKEQRKSRAYLN